jgi:hypothetical protein
MALPHSAVTHTQATLCVSVSLCARVCVAPYWRGVRSDVINQNIGLIAGVAVAIILMFVLLVVGALVYRRSLLSKQKKLLEEYSSQLQMLTLNRSGILPNSFGGGTMTSGDLRANLQVPKTQFAGADATLLNTVMEVALPGFLLLEYATDLRPEARLTAGGAGTIFRATLLDAQAVQRNGGEIVALKEVCRRGSRVPLLVWMGALACLCVCVGMQMPLFVC